MEQSTWAAKYIKGTILKEHKVNLVQLASAVLVLVIVASEPNLSSIERIVPFNFIAAFTFYLVSFVQIRLHKQSVGVTTLVAIAITGSIFWSVYQGDYYVLWYIPVLVVAAYAGYFVIGQESADRVAQTA